MALRPEPFGALLYHFGTRRLSFLKDPVLLTVVQGLADHPSARSACESAGVGARRCPPTSGRCGTLASSAMIRVRDDGTLRRDVLPLTAQFARGLSAPICLTWELTYACNLSCVHCLSSSGRRDPRELSTAQCQAVIDELERMQVFYVNIGGGEPTVRPDFWELVDYAVAHRVGVKFSTNGVKITPGRRPAAGRLGLRRRADLARRRDAGGQRRRARDRLVPDRRSARCPTSPRRAFAASSSRWS